jgi:hypothetical protein
MEQQVWSLQRARRSTLRPRVAADDQPCDLVSQLTINLTPTQRRTLLAWQRATTISAGLARRGRIILLVADGVPITDITAMVGISRNFVYKWAQRFLEQGLGGLADKPGRGHRRVPHQATPKEQQDMDVR